ncbi:cytochrome c nitrite reductase subunit NrfD [Pasteurellaceae bacterium RH1A]|nr:cytochrome c nitrite reductase subunit NrfD [Pasteurellaceae bacterium RH1A]
MNGAETFQSPMLVWNWTVAIYLFLLGISSGATLIAVLFKRSSQKEDLKQSFLVRSAVVIAPISLTLGLIILIFHLTMPWRFWFLMFNYQPKSIMSFGVMMFQIYMGLLALWFLIIYQDWVAKMVRRYVPALAKVVKWVTDLSEKFENIIELLLIFFAVALGAYTGFLISVLISYPMLNNPVLPILFLASGTSSGIGALLIAVLVFGKLSTHSREVHFLHRFETPTMLIELFLIFAFCLGLWYGGGQKTASLLNALNSVWGYVFYIGILGIGLLLPLIANALAPYRLKHSKGFIVILALCGLFGVMCLRFFILYAGQMTLA